MSLSFIFDFYCLKPLIVIRLKNGYNSMYNDKGRMVL